MPAVRDAYIMMLRRKSAGGNCTL